MLDLVPLALAVATVLAYAAGLSRLRSRGVPWPVGRTVCVLLGSACVAVAVLPPFATHDEQFSVHVGQHLLLGMTGPGLLALSAPITLALRTVPTRPRRTLLRLLHSRVARVITAAPTAVVLDLGGLYVLYLTGLYARAEDNEVLHAAVHLHMFLAGCLVSWAVVGIDPIRRRPGFPVRIAALVVAGAGHDTLSKLMYARGLPVGGGPLHDRQLGGQLMYYGGTLVDLALAVVVMAQWWRVSGRALARSTVPAGRATRAAASRSD